MKNTRLSTGAPRCALTVSKYRLASRVILFISLCTAIMSASAQTVTINPLSLYFSDANIGRQSQPQIVTVTNTGVSSAPIAISITEASGGVTFVPSVPQFTETNNCGTSLAAGASCSISVVCVPTIQYPYATMNVSPSASNPVSLDASAPPLGNSDLVVDIDAPTTSTPVSGKFLASGWAISNGSAVNYIYYGIDVNQYSNYAVYGYSRSDVCQVYPGRDGCPNVGWQASIDTTALANGTHTLYVVAISNLGDSSVATRQFTVSNSLSGTSPKLFVDQPSSSSTLSGTATLSGWSLNADNDYAVNTIHISVDGVPVGTTTASQSRPDVCNVYPNRPYCPNVGWTFQLDTTQLVDGAHTVTFETLGPTVTCTSSLQYQPCDYGSQPLSISVPVTVSNLGASSPVKVFIDSPNGSSGNLSGMPTFSGWALSTSALINSVSIAVDGEHIANASYGSSRPDVCVAYQSAQGCPAGALGWTYSLDTTRLSDGTHQLEVTANPASGTGGSISTPFTVANASSTNPIHAFVDYPNAGRTLTGTATVSGWAVNNNPNTTVSFVRIAVDGVPQGLASYGTYRPDVCASYPDAGCPNVGWGFTLNTASLINGTHTLDVIVTSGSQHSTFTTSFTSANGSNVTSTLMNIDQPSAGSGALTGNTTVSGWAIDDYTTPYIQVFVDGFDIGYATYGTNRADVCTVYPGSNDCPNVGWSFALDTTSIPNGTHALTVVTNGSSQVTASRQITVSNAATAFNSVKVNIDEPTSNAPSLQGIVDVSGWAIAKTGGLSYVQLYVDLQPMSSASFSVARPDVCGAFPSAANCPNVGWSTTMDTTTIPDGPHTLYVTTGGLSNMAFASMPITIANGSATAATIRMSIDSAGATLSGTANLNGWALSDNAAITSVAVSIDGTSQGNATYGDSRGDVCAIYESRSGCPNVGWHLSLNTTSLSNGNHTASVTATSASGQTLTQTATITVHN